MPQITKSLSKPLGASILIALALMFPGTTYIHAQSPATVSGRVSGNDGASLSMASVTIEGLNRGEVADVNGVYRITDIPAGTYSISTIVVGYKKQTKEITVKAGQNATLDFSLEEEIHGLEEVTITGEKSKAQQVREQAFTVSSIDVTPLQNLNLDVNTVLNRSTGIRIRQGGGLGSDFSFSLNGFTGNQVRFFVDGIAADYLGAAMRFNNIPVNIIERIEVYKGVVPVYLGADALGGAVNIVTSDNAKDFLDVSYSYGSFNTHQAAIASRATFKKKFVVNASGFFNYSDNDFTIDAPYIGENGKIGPDRQYKLFNEQYRSSSIMFETGVIHTKWADRFLIGVIASENEKHNQRGQSMVRRPAGEVFTTDEGFTPTLKYQKKDLGVKNLSLNLAAIYSETQSMRVDTSSRVYNWDGTSTARDVEMTSGELSWYKTNFRFDDKSLFNTATLEYAWGRHHTFTLNNTYSYFRRVGSDPIASRYTENIAFSEPNTVRKNITGLSYKLGLLENRLNATIFVKLFNMTSDVRVENPDVENEYLEQKTKNDEHGEGVAASYFLTKELVFKTSFEQTTRLPDTDEMFGDGMLLQPNLTLQPEKSKNFNFDVLYTKRLTDNHSISLEGGFIYRLPENMIRQVAIGVLSQYQNLTKAKVLGGETTLRYSYKRRLNVELNATYQDLRNNDKDITSYNDPLYHDRLPNIPYFFGNAMVGLMSPQLGDSKWQVGFNWATMFVEHFYLYWPSQGNREDKYDIPRQVSHDASVTLSSMAGRYNLSFSCWNLTDTKLYDNYKIQRPGRSFNVKLRFFINKFKD